MSESVEYILWGLYGAYVCMVIGALAIGEYEKKWQFVFDIIVPFGAVLRGLTLGIYELTRNIIKEFKELG